MAAVTGAASRAVIVSCRCSSDAVGFDPLYWPACSIGQLVNLSQQYPSSSTNNPLFIFPHNTTLLQGCKKHHKSRGDDNHNNGPILKLVAVDVQVDPVDNPVLGASEPGVDIHIDPSRVVLLRVEIDDGRPSLSVRVVQQLILLRAVLEGLAHNCAGYPVGEGALNFGDHAFGARVGEVDPPEPAMRVLVTLVHHRHIPTPLFPQDEHLAEDGTHSQSLHILQSGFHEGVQVEGGRVVVVVAEDGGVGVAVAAWGVREPALEVVQPCYWLEADVMIGVHFTDLGRQEIVGSLQVGFL